MIRLLERSFVRISVVNRTFTELVLSVREATTFDTVTSCSLPSYANITTEVFCYFGLYKVYKPVSYTHLDVYKRQVLGFLFLCILKEYNCYKNESDKLCILVFSSM